MSLRYHESSQMSSLVETFVSKASALQRQGRAGRVRNGFCFRLYPKFRYGGWGSIMEGKNELYNVDQTLVNGPVLIRSALV